MERRIISRIIVVIAIGVSVLATDHSVASSATLWSSPPQANCPPVKVLTATGKEALYPQTSANVTCREAAAALRSYYADVRAGKCRGSGCFASIRGGWTCDSPTWDPQSGVAVGCDRHKEWIVYGWIPGGAHSP